MGLFSIFLVAAAATRRDGGNTPPEGAYADEAYAATKLERSERFELPTLGIEIRCSIQLSYERIGLFRHPNAWAPMMATAFRHVLSCSHLAANFSIPRQPARRRDSGVVRRRFWPACQRSS
jgi:hypothetical protein